MTHTGQMNLLTKKGRNENEDGATKKASGRQPSRLEVFTVNTSTMNSYYMKLYNGNYNKRYKSLPRIH